MGRTRLAKASIVELKKRIEIAERRKKYLEEYLHNLWNSYQKGLVSRDFYVETAHRHFEGKTLKEWIDFYEHYIHECEVLIRKKKKETVKGPLAAFIFASIIIFLVFFLISKTPVQLPITGFASFNPNDTRQIGYEFLDDNGNVVDAINGITVHTWNTKDDYFFNKSSGIQFSNHFQEYWTHNIFCGGYKNVDDDWVYDCNDALPFNWDIKTDNETYVNITGWRDITIGTKQVRTAIRYHLKTNDQNLTIQMQIENIGEEDINTDLGFAWRVNDIKINNDYENDKILINNSRYNLNETLDLSFTNLNDSYYNLEDNGYVRLDWNKNLNYVLKVKSQAGQYNAPVTLGINIGTLSVGQEKHTTLYWKDPTTIVNADSATSSDDGDVLTKINADGGTYDDVDHTEYTDVTFENLSADIINNVTLYFDIEFCDAAFQFNISITAPFSSENVCIFDGVTGMQTCDFYTAGIDTIDELNQLEMRYTGLEIPDTGGPDDGGVDWVYLDVDYANLPSFSNPAENDSDIFQGDYVNHSITIGESPTQYLFSWNASGASCDTWVNSSWIDVGGESTTAWNASVIPNECTDKTIGWKFWANNSVGISASDVETYAVNSYGWLNVSISKPDDDSGWYQNDANLTVNATITCSGSGANAKCGTVEALARYNLTASPDTAINITEGATPFYITGIGGWDLSTASYDNVNISIQDILPKGLFFKSDGTKLYEIGTANNLIYQSSCSDAWNLSSCSYDNVNLSPQDALPRTLFFKSDGSKLYESGIDAALIYQSSCSDAWNLSSCSYDNVNISTQDSTTLDLFFKSDGTKLYEIGNSVILIYQSSCSDAWNLSSCSYDDINISTQDALPYSLFFKSDGTKLYELGRGADLIYQYTCSDAWNLSSCSYDNVNISTQDSSPYGLFFKSDGSKLYEIGSSAELIYQSSLSFTQNPESQSLSKDESWNVSWTLNVTTASTESYLIDVLFNSSYGSENVQENHTADRQVNLNPPPMYGWLNVSISKPDDNSEFNQGDTNLTINATVTCEGDAGAVCGTVSALARYNLTANPDTAINTTEGASPFFAIGGGIITSDYNGVNTANDGDFPNTTFQAAQGMGASCTNNNPYSPNIGPSSTTTLTNPEYSEIWTSDFTNYTISEQTQSADCAVFHINISEDSEEFTFYWVGYGDSSANGEKISIWNVTANSWSTLDDAIPSSRTSQEWVFLDVSNYLDVNVIHILITGGEHISMGGGGIYTDYLNISFTEAVAENPQSTTLNKDDSYQFNWTLNVTTASTESYLIDVLFNSSYGSENVPNNDTEDRTVDLNPSVDTQAPKWFDNSTNGTQAGTYIEHRVRWTDTALAGYIFSFDNGTGTLTNDSWVSMTGTNNWSNVSKIVNSTVGSTIRWQVYANDTASPSNWNATDVFQYDTTGNNPPTHTTPGIVSTSGNNLTADNITCYNQSTNDIDGDAVTNIYNWYKDGTSITVLNMPFDTNTTSTASGAVKDYSGYNNNGTISDITAWNTSQDCIKGGCYEFDRTDDFINISDHASLNFTGNFTIAHWIKTDNVSYPWQSSIIKGPYDESQRAWSIYLNYDEVYISWNNGGWRSFVTTSANLEAGQWYHIAYTRNASDEIIYVNGNNTEQQSIQYSMVHSPYHIIIGGNPKWSSERLDGVIDEVKIYNISLSADQVYQLYLEGNNSYTNSTITASETSTGENWTCSITPNDATDDGTTLNSSTMGIVPGNNPPTIDWVESISSIGPVDDATRPITFNFTATDQEGASDINISTAQARFQLTGEATRSNLSCVNWSQSGDDVNFTCTIDMWYFDKADTGWKINVTIKDINDAYGENSSTNFSYTSFMGMKMSPTSLEWPEILIGQANIGSNNDPIIVNNTGNDEPLSINVTALDLRGERVTTEFILAGNFSVENASEGCDGTAMSNASSLNITSAILYRGNHSLNYKNATSGQEQIYFCLTQVPSGISQQSYSSSFYGAWEIRILLVAVIPAGRRRKKKLKKRKEIIENLSIPATIFSENIGALETVTKYLRENLGMSYHEIARYLNRDERTIWTAYQKAVQKQHQMIEVKETKIFLPVSILRNRKLTVLESIIVYIKSKEMKYSEIAEIIERDQRNIRTAYQKAIKKLKEREFKDLIKTEAELIIPATIFSKKLGALESLVKYMKENLNMSYKEIAEKLGRDKRTIWTAYHKAIEKQPEMIEIKETNIFLPISIFKKLTILASIIIYLKSKGFKFSEIAELIERDQRNIWTIYSRAIKKITS